MNIRIQITLSESDRVEVLEAANELGVPFGTVLLGYCLSLGALRAMQANGTISEVVETIRNTAEGLEAGGIITAPGSVTVVVNP